MKYRPKRDGRGIFALVRYVVLGERSKFLLLGEAVRGFTDFYEGTDIVRRKLAVQNEASQRVTLPGRAALRTIRVFLAGPSPSLCRTSSLTTAYQLSQTSVVRSVPELIEHWPAREIESPGHRG